MWKNLEKRCSKVADVKQSQRVMEAIRKDFPGNRKKAFIGLNSFEYRDPARAAEGAKRKSAKGDLTKGRKQVGCGLIFFMVANSFAEVLFFFGA